MRLPLSRGSHGLGDRWRRRRERYAAERGWVVPFFTLFSLLFLGDLAAAPARSLLPVYGEAVLERHASFTSMLISARLLFAMAAAFIGGALSDALGQKRVMILGLSGLPVICAVFLFQSPWALVLLSAYAGFTSGAYYLGGESYMLGTVPGRFIGLAAGMVFAGQTFGGALGNSIAGPLVDGQGFAALGLVTGALATLVVLGGIFLLPDRPRSQERRSGGAALGYGAILRRPSVVLLGLLRLLPTCYYGTTMLLVPLLIYRLAETPSAAAYYGTGALVFASLCQLLAGRLCDRFGRRVPVVVSCALIAAISLATAAFTGSLVGLYVCGILGVGFAWSLAVAVPGLVTDVAPPEERGRTLGFTHVAWYAGMIAGTQAAGWLVDYGSALPFVIMGLLNAVSVLLALALVRRIAGGSPQPAPSG